MEYSIVPNIIHFESSQTAEEEKKHEASEPANAE